MRSRFAFGLLVLLTAASCAQPDIVSVKAPPDARDDPPPVGTFNGAPVDGRWLFAAGAHFLNLTVDVKENSGGIVTGTFSGDWDLCDCTITGRVTETGAPFNSEIGFQVGSYRRGRAVRLFFTFGQGPAAPFKPFAWYDGLLIDATRATGSLTVVTGEGYYGLDSYGQGDIEMQKSKNP